MCRMVRAVCLNSDIILTFRSSWVIAGSPAAAGPSQDPTASWGNAPATTSREVGWFITRQAETNRVRRANQAKWRLPKQSCEETLYSTEYVKFAGTSPFSNKGRADASK